MHLKPSTKGFQTWRLASPGGSYENDRFAIVWTDLGAPVLIGAECRTPAYLQIANAQLLKENINKIQTPTCTKAHTEKKSASIEASTARERHLQDRSFQKRLLETKCFEEGFHCLSNWLVSDRMMVSLDDSLSTSITWDLLTINLNLHSVVRKLKPVPTRLPGCHLRDKGSGVCPPPAPLANLGKFPTPCKQSQQLENFKLKPQNTSASSVRATCHLEEESLIRSYKQIVTWSPTSTKGGTGLLDWPTAIPSLHIIICANLSRIMNHRASKLLRFADYVP